MGHVARIALLAGLAGIMALLVSDHAREYRLYFTETRPSATIDFAALPQEATERDIRAAHPLLALRCYTNRPGEYLDDRSCFADVSALNGTPALSISFHFASGKLNRMSANIPWWAHRAAYEAITGIHGPPVASQARAVASVRLHGWALPDGGALFYNRDRPLNPLRFNGLLWVSSRQCARQGCLAVARGDRRHR
jgi:hypothetical protein